MATSKRGTRTIGRSPNGESQLPAPQPSRPWDRALRPYLSASHTAYENAASLRVDAALLLRQKRYARAAALSVTGLEEAGKALVLWFIGIGHTKESKRAELLKAIRSKHTLKQAVALPLRVIGRVIPLARRMHFDLPRGMRRRIKDWGEVERVLSEMIPAIIANAQALVSEAGLSDDTASIEQEAQRVIKGSLEQRRQRSLYTDLEGFSVSSPGDVTRAEARELVRDLRICLLALKPLSDVAEFGDEGVDGLLAATQMWNRVWALPVAGTAG